MTTVGTRLKGLAKQIQHHPLLLNPTLLDDVAHCWTRQPNECNIIQHYIESNIDGRGGQTNTTCWMQHLGSRGLGPKSTQNPSKTTTCHIGLSTKWRVIDRSTVKRCLAALALLEMLEEEDNIVTKRGKTRHWIKRRGEKGYINNIVTKLMIAAAETLQFLATGETYRS